MLLADFICCNIFSQETSSILRTFSEGRSALSKIFKYFCIGLDPSLRQISYFYFFPHSSARVYWFSIKSIFFSMICFDTFDWSSKKYARSNTPEFTWTTAFLLLLRAFLRLFYLLSVSRTEFLFFSLLSISFFYV